MKKGRWLISLVLAFSLLCGMLPVYAADTAQTERQTSTETAPQAPENIQAEALADGGIRLTWQAASGVSGYRIYRWEDDGWTLLHIERDAEITVYTDMSAEPDTEYRYTVRSYLTEDGVITLSAIPSDDVRAVTVSTLGTPVLLSAESGGYDRISIVWKAVGGASGYEILRRTGDSSWTRIAAVSGLYTTSYTDQTAVCGTYYQYTVRACGERDGETIYSDYDETGLTGRAVPAATTVKATGNTDSISLSWTAVDGASGYHIYRKTSAGGTWTYLNSVGGSNTGYQDKDITTGQRYYYAVAAYCKLSDGSQCVAELSAAVSAVSALAAPALGSVTMSSKGLTVTWSGVSGAAGYVIYRRAAGETGWKQLAVVGKDVRSYDDQTVTDGKTYYYTVAARSAAGTVGAYHTSGISGVYYSYKIALQNGNLPTNIALPNVTKETFGTSAEGRALNAYTVGTGSKHMVLNFAIHGWEDHYSRDGYELVRVAVEVLEKLSANASTVTKRGWSVTVIPYANPDGIVSGYSHNGPGRCTTYRYNSSGSLVKGGVDMNRCFPAGFKQYTSARNYTGSQPLMAKEAKALKKLIDSKKGSSTNVFIDIHGWTQQILTNTSGSGFVYSTLHSYFPNNSAGGLGGGYISRYAKSVGYSACLFEFPRNVYSHTQMVNYGYSTTFVNAVWSMICNY